MTRDLWTTAGSRYQAERYEQAEVIANVHKEIAALRQELTQTQEAHAYLQRDYDQLTEKYNTQVAGINAFFGGKG
jgi:predicted  nucleic acid-binding Zn-ribbon protein